MAINANDIKLFESERMADTADGGGRMTVSEIPDGVAGNVFPKVSRLDSVYGRFQLRKIYASVQTANQDVYAGAHMFITDPPDNAGVGVTLFSTGSHFDVRTDAVNRVESYVVKGPPSRMTLYGQHYAGQSSIIVYQRESEPVIEVSSVVCLSIEGVGLTPAEQYVRISDILANEVREFTTQVAAGGEVVFRRRMLTLRIDSILRQDFPGVDEVAPVQVANLATVVRTTSAQDAARYFGITPIDAVSAGALTVQADSIYANLVPTATRETGLSLVSADGADQYIASGAARQYDTVTGWTFAPATDVTLHLGRGARPGSVTVSVYLTALQTPEFVATDDRQGGFGTLPVAAGVYPIAIDYDSGDITITSTASGSTPRRIVVDYTPAAVINTTSHTSATAITLGNRGSIYNLTLAPAPAPGTVRLAYRALGRWYVLEDDRNGLMRGADSAYGTGTVDYATGAASVTLGALPDVASDVIWSWGTPISHTIRAAGTSDAGATLQWGTVLPDAPAEPGSVALSFVRGGVPVPVTDSGGIMTGAGVTGTINYATGRIDLEFSNLPDQSTAITIDYNQQQDGGSPATASGNLAVGNPAAFSLGVTNITAPGVALGILVLPGSSSQPISVSAADDGAGNLVCYSTVAGSMIVPSQTVGTINYATGDVALQTSGLTVYLTAYNGTWARVDVGGGATAGTYTYSLRTAAAATPVAAPQVLLDLSTSPPWVNLTRTVSDLVMADALLMTITGRRYLDRSGQLYVDLDAQTGSALPAGSIDYAAGVAYVTAWTDNVATALTIEACVTAYGAPFVTEFAHRTAGSPVRPASYSVQITATDGTLLTATSDLDGVIAGTDVSGQIRQPMGSVTLSFARNVQPETLRYSAVVTSAVPLDASILGIENTRLPPDGRVPVFRAGDVGIIHNTQSDTLPSPAVASATYAMPRGDLGALRLVDQAGTIVDRAQYTVDLVAGSVTMSATLDLSAYTEPLVAQHRIEERLLISDVQINGTITFTAALANAYPAAGSYISSALLAGDLFARVENVFDQQTWTGEWSDVLIGNGATPEYDDINFPIECDNQGAVTERWRMHFTGTTSFQVIGENLGVIATGTTGADVSPVNPITGLPYFTLRASGWGGGWSIGNNLRFNTVGAAAAAWITRTVLSGATLAGDAFDLSVAGDVD